MTRADDSYDKIKTYKDYAAAAEKTRPKDIRTTLFLSCILFSILCILSPVNSYTSLRPLHAGSLRWGKLTSSTRGLTSLNAASGLSGADDVMLGAPHNRRPSSGTFTSDKGVEVTFDVKSVVNPDTEVDKLVDLIDNQVGVLLTSSYEYPGRYSRWTVGFVAPALQIEGL